MLELNECFLLIYSIKLVVQGNQSMSQAFDARRREIFRINFEPCPALLISEFVLGDWLQARVFHRDYQV